jgi:hypothetical protein
MQLRQREGVLMLKFFIDKTGTPVRRVYTENAMWAADPGRTASVRNGGIELDNGVLGYLCRELTPAEFLEVTRGEPIADKALELLAAERGCRCYFQDQWYLQTDTQDLYGAGVCVKASTRPLPDDAFRRHDSRTITELLTSDFGKTHRKAIEEFILSLPVVSESTNEEKAEPEETPEPEAVKCVYVIFLLTNHGHDFHVKTCTHDDAIEFAKQKSAENVDCGVHVAPITDTYITRSVTETVRL